MPSKRELVEIDAFDATLAAPAVGSGHDHLASVAKFAMVAPMFFARLHRCHRRGQALIAAQFATVLQAVWRAIGNSWTPASWPPAGQESDGSSAKIISADPPIADAHRCGSCCAVGFEGGDEVLGWTLRPASADRRRKAGLAFEALSVATPRSVKSCEPGGHRTWTGQGRCCLRGRSGAMRSQRTHFGRCVPRSRSRRFGSASSGRQG